jgi:hypothetical protein
MEGEVAAKGPDNLAEDGKIHPYAVTVGVALVFAKCSSTEISRDRTSLTALLNPAVMPCIHGQHSCGRSRRRVPAGPDEARPGSVLEW